MFVDFWSHSMTKTQKTGTMQTLSFIFHSTTVLFPLVLFYPLYLYSFIWAISIQPWSQPLVLWRVTWMLEPLPAGIGEEAGYTPGWSPVHRRANIHTQTQTQTSIHTHTWVVKKIHQHQQSGHTAASRCKVLSFPTWLERCIRWWEWVISCSQVWSQGDAATGALSQERRRPLICLDDPPTERRVYQMA